MSAIAAVSSPGPSRALIWGALAALAVIVPLAPTFASMVAIWNRDATFTHGYFIPLLTAFLLWSDRRALGNVPVAPAPIALLPLGVLSLVWFLANLADIQVLRQGAAVALIPCAVWLVLGTPFARRARFALAYLMFAVPFGDFLVPYLVEFTTHFTVGAVKLVGVPIYREGTMFALPSGNFEVVKACSGVRYLIATLALGTLFAGFMYESWRRRMAFMALCLVLPVIANGLRAFGIVMIAHYSELRYAVGLDHFIYGWVFFGLVIGLLFWIGAKFADRREEDLVVATVPGQRYSALHLAAIVLIVGAAVGSNSLWRATAASSGEQSLGLIDAPTEWTGPSATMGWLPAFARDDSLNSQIVSGVYKSKHGEVHLAARAYVGHAEAEEATAALLIADGQSELRFDQHGHHLTGDGHEVEAALIAHHAGQRWRVWRWYYVDGAVATSARDAKRAQLRAWFAHRRPNTVLVSAAVPVHDTRDATVAQADRLLDGFLSATRWRVRREP